MQFSIVRQLRSRRKKTTGSTCTVISSTSSFNPKKESVDRTLEMSEYPAGQDPNLGRLISTFRGQVCRSSVESQRVKVAARHDQLWVVSVRCHRCRNQQT